ncbi:MAG: hypothetical protein AAGD38_04310 [Acidobacteriota bacterium]
MIRRTLFFALVLLVCAVGAHADGERQAKVFEVSADPSSFELPALTVVNPHLDRAIDVHVVAWSSEHDARRELSVVLEAGGRTQVTLDADVVFDRLVAKSEARFEADLESRASGAATQLRIGGSTLFECNGIWTLTCDWPGCSLGPFNSTGYVRPGGRVYWNLNYPTGTPYETQNNQGLTADWSGIDSDGCPSTVTNSLGDTYIVTVELFPTFP